MEDPTAVAAVRLVATSIAPDPVVANLSAGAAAANLGAAITLTGGLRKKDTTPFSGIPAQVEMKTSSTDWTKIYGVNTSADGTLSIPLVVAENVQLRIRADGTWDRLAALSTPVSVNVSRLISINLPTSMKHGVAYVITGQLQPKEAGITVHLDNGSTASPADAVTAVTDTSGHFTFTLTAGKAGTYSWRASIDADTRFIASQSDFVTVVVR
jgi:hypothetical protein